LLPPARTDPVSGYRFYSEDQVDGALLVALLRRLGMPVPVIVGIAAKPAGEAAEAVGSYWAGVESVMADRRVLVSYIQAKLTGANMAMYDVQTRVIPERTLFSISRHLHSMQTGAGAWRSLWPRRRIWLATPMRHTATGSSSATTAFTSQARIQPPRCRRFLQTPGLPAVSTVTSAGITGGGGRRWTRGRQLRTSLVSG
jgi:DNA-binding transcriptional MerR regulator